MLKPVLFALTLAIAAPASASTVADFSTTLDISLQSSPGVSLVVAGGFLPAPAPTFLQTGDVTLTTGDEGGGAACCFTGDVTSPAVTPIGQMALSATGTVLSAPGEVRATGENRAGFSVANQGGVPETVTLSFDIDQFISQIVGPVVGGAAASGTELTIQRDGETIFNNALLSLSLGGATADTFSDVFEYTFDFPATGATSTDFIISMTGGVHAASTATDVTDTYPAPVPLPAGAALLLAGLGALGVIRRRTVG